MQKTSKVLILPSGGHGAYREGLTGPPNFWNKNKCVSTNGQSRLASVVYEGVLGPPHLVWHN